MTKFDYAKTFLSNPNEKTIDAAKKAKEISEHEKEIRDSFWIQSRMEQLSILNMKSQFH